MIVAGQAILGKVARGTGFEWRCITCGANRLPRCWVVITRRAPVFPQKRRAISSRHVRPSLWPPREGRRQPRFHSQLPWMNGSTPGDLGRHGHQHDFTAPARFATRASASGWRPHVRQRYGAPPRAPSFGLHERGPSKMEIRGHWPETPPPPHHTLQRIETAAALEQQAETARNDGGFAVN